MNDAFLPQRPTIKVSATQAATLVALNGNNTPQIVTYVEGSNKVYIAFGDATVVANTSDMPLLPNSKEPWTTGLYTHVSLVCDTGATATVYITKGNGI